jgi:hypothetical protein
MTYLCRVTGQIETQELGIPRWVDPNVIIVNQGIPSSFSEYNVAMFQALTNMDDAVFLKLQTEIEMEVTHILES